MNGLTDTLCMDLITNALNTMGTVVSAVGDNSIVMRSMCMSAFVERMEDTVKRFNLVYCQSSNSYHKILCLDTAKSELIIDESDKYDINEVRRTICYKGLRHNDLYNKDFIDQLNSGFDCEYGSFEQVYADFLMYRAFLSVVLYDTLLSIIFESPGVFIPFINPDDPEAYIFLSMNLNSWWNGIANMHVQPLTNNETGRTIIPWIRPNIVTRKDMKFRFYDVKIVDMFPVFKDHLEE